MRTVCFILALFVAILHLTPCVDEVPHMVANTAHTTDGHHDDEGCIDGCSPFCVCSCCNVIVLVAGFYFDGKPGQTEMITLSSRFQDGYAAFYPNFWQPPRI